MGLLGLTEMSRQFKASFRDLRVVAYAEQSKSSHEGMAQAAA